MKCACVYNGQECHTDTQSSGTLCFSAKHSVSSYDGHTHLEETAQPARPALPQLIAALKLHSPLLMPHASAAALAAKSQCSLGLCKQTAGGHTAASCASMTHDCRRFAHDTGLDRKAQSMKSVHRNAMSNPTDTCWCVADTSAVFVAGLALLALAPNWHT